MSFQTVGSEEALYAILLVGKTYFEEKIKVFSPAPRPPNLKLGILHSWIFTLPLQVGFF